MATQSTTVEAKPLVATGRLDTWVFVVAGAVLAVLLLTSGRYGYFRDTLYYMACARHMAWGYVDQPPLVVGLFWAVMHTLGTSLLALAIVPALADAAVVVMAGTLARALGGGRFAQALAAAGTACSLVYWVEGRQFSMNILEPLLWMGCAYLLIRIVESGDQRLWIWFGVLAGLGMENKYSMGVFATGVVVALLATSERRAFARKWIWIGGLIALGIFLPNLIWNIGHRFPFVELMHNIRASGRNVSLGPVAYWISQAFMLSPINIVLWLPGLIWLFAARHGRYRVLGWTFVVTAGIFMALHGKDYYTAPIYPLLLAAGAVGIEAVSAARGRWLRPAVVAALVILTAPMIPVVVPVLSLPMYLRYQARLPFQIGHQEKAQYASPLPQFYSDELGWRQMTAEAARAYFALPAAERADTAIFAPNYGEAGAIDFFGPKLGLPAAISPHQSYFYWGPRQYTGTRLIALGGSREDYLAYYRQVTQVGMKDRADALEHGPIWLCEDPRSKSNLQRLWPSLKDWD